MSTTRSALERARPHLRRTLSITMITVGVLHFVIDDLFAQIVPKALPAPYVLVWLSGVVEIALGVALWIPKTRRLAGLGLVALYLAVFPANIYMAMANVQLQGLPDWVAQPSPLALWLRLPFQLVFIGWALWVSREPSHEPGPQLTAAASH